MQVVRGIGVNSGWVTGVTTGSVPIGVGGADGGGDGDMGPPGAPGQPGAAGATGAQGPPVLQQADDPAETFPVVGPPGPTGSTGATGNTGPVASPIALTHDEVADVFPIPGPPFDISALPELAPVITDYSPFYYVAGLYGAKAKFNVLGGLLRRSPGGRLTGVSGTAIGDTSANTNIYYVPYEHGDIQLYDGSKWVLFNSIGNITLALGTLTSGKNYDVFIYSNSGTPTLELSAAWSSDTARTDALTTQDGWQVKSGAATRLWLGTIRTISTTQVQDDVLKRFIWNAYNRVHRQVSVWDSTDTWTDNTATWKQWNTSTANQIGVVTGLDSASVINMTFDGIGQGTSLQGKIGIGEDSTTAWETTGSGPSFNLGPPAGAAWTNTAFIARAVPLGYHYYTMLQYGHASVVTWSGDAGVPLNFKSMMSGTWQA